MTGVTGVSNNGTGVNQSTGSGQLEVNQNQFIELFVAQLKNQDPLAPMGYQPDVDAVVANIFCRKSQ